MAVKKCSKCSADFMCTNEQRGCWCENLYISPAGLKALKESYDNCLCPVCLSTYAEPAPKNTCSLQEK